MLPCPHLGPSTEPELVRTSPEIDGFELLSEDGWDDSLPFYGDPLPLAVPAGCNVYPSYKKRAVQYVWLHVSLCDGVERADDRHAGRHHAYFDELIRDTGWECLLNNEDTSPEGYTRWLMGEGLAPGQRFLCSLEYTSYQSYEGEWDGDWDVTIVARETLCRMRTRLAWALALQEAKIPVIIFPR